MTYPLYSAPLKIYSAKLLTGELNKTSLVKKALSKMQGSLLGLQNAERGVAYLGHPTSSIRFYDLKDQSVFFSMLYSAMGSPWVNSNYRLTTKKGTGVFIRDNEQNCYPLKDIINQNLERLQSELKDTDLDLELSQDIITIKNMLSHLHFEGFGVMAGFDEETNSMSVLIPFQTDCYNLIRLEFERKFLACLSVVQ